MAKKQTAKPRQTGADPQGTRDARDDATMIQWLSTIDADLTSGFRTLAQVFRQRDKSASVTAPGALEQKPVLSEILYQPGAGFRPPPIRPVPPAPPTAPAGGGAVAPVPAEEGESRGRFADAFATLTNALSGLRNLFRRGGEGGPLHAASGANFVTRGPTRLLVGEAGPEKVQVTPLSQGRKPGPLDKPEGGEMRMQGGGTLTAGLGAIAGNVLGVGLNVLLPGLGTLVAGLTTAFTQVFQHMIQFGSHLREANRQLAQFAPSMAAVFAQSHVRDIQRGLRVGEATAGTAGFFERSLSDLRDSLATITVPLRNMANVLLGALVQGINALLQPIVGLLEWLKKMWPFGKRDDDKTEGITIGQWLDEIRDDEDKRQRRQPFQPRFAGGLP